MTDAEWALGCIACGGKPVTAQDRLCRRIRHRLAQCVDVISEASDRLCTELVAEAAQTYSTTVATPSYFVEMLLWIEDKRFPVHPGLDPAAILRALYFDLRGGRLQGASTISQQLYNIRSSRVRVSRSLRFKLRQACCSIYLSATNDKAALLKEYINNVYWGRSYYGLDAAARGYFGTVRQSLSPAESFFLAERLANPNRVSIPRILNLLRRTPISSSLKQSGVVFDDIVGLYARVCCSGGEKWQIPVK